MPQLYNKISKRKDIEEAKITSKQINHRDFDFMIILQMVFIPGPKENKTEHVQPAVPG